MAAKIILFADNDPDFLTIRKEFLEQAGYTVVTATNVLNATRLLERGGVDLAIMDIRLVDDSDEEDTSGLELARKFGPAIPIIMLTGYPTWESVKIALAQDLNGLSPAVDFLSKYEGPDLMVQAVDLTLVQPRLKRNMLVEFQAESSQALHEVIQKKEPAENTDKFQKSLMHTERELLQHRKELSQQSERYQKTAIWMGLVGMGVIVIGAFLVFFKVTSLVFLSGISSLVSEAISVLFIARTVQLAKQVDLKYEELQEIYRASHLISICDTIESKSKREDAKILIVEKLAGKWFS